MPSYEEENTVLTQTETLGTTSVLEINEAAEEAQEETELLGEEDRVEGNTMNQFSDILRNT